MKQLLFFLIFLFSPTVFADVVQESDVARPAQQANVVEDKEVKDEKTSVTEKIVNGVCVALTIWWLWSAHKTAKKTRKMKDQASFYRAQAKEAEKESAEYACLTDAQFAECARLICMEEALLKNQLEQAGRIAKLKEQINEINPSLTEDQVRYSDDGDDSKVLQELQKGYQRLEQDKARFLESLQVRERRAMTARENSRA